MKLSEMTTAQMAPVLVSLSEPIGNIATDQKTVESLQEIAKGKTQIEQLGMAVTAILPLLLKTHFEDTCAIIAALSGKTVEQVINQKGFQTIKDAKDIFDKELLDFFKSSVHTEPQK